MVSFKLLNLGATVALFAALLFGINTEESYAQSKGPDVIVGSIDNLIELERTSEGFIALTASTDSCNVGDARISWYALPSSDHPVIALNLYKRSNGRLIQIAQSWVKHGFYAVNSPNCPSFNSKTFTCSDPIGGQTLNPGCSDLYNEFLNADPEFLGPRSKINPSTGRFDGETALDLTGYPESTDLERILYFPESLLSSYATQQFFLESIYISGDDSKAGHAANNASYRIFTPQRTTAGSWYFINQSPMKLGVPAITEWRGELSTIQEVTLDEVGGAKSSVYVGSKVIEEAGGQFRYEYVIFNLNSDAAIGMLKLPIGAEQIKIDSNGYSAPKANGEIWSETKWEFGARDRAVSWRTENADVNPRANAIRWGTAYNFWFRSSKAPRRGEATIGRFKAEASPRSFTAQVYIPNG